MSGIEWVIVILAVLLGPVNLGITAYQVSVLPPTFITDPQTGLKKMRVMPIWRVLLCLIGFFILVMMLVEF